MYILEVYINIYLRLYTTIFLSNYNFYFDFCLTVHHQLGKVIQKNQLDATIIYWTIRSAQHVSGNLLPIIRSVRLRFLQHMVSSCCGGQGVGERQRGTMCHAAAHRLAAHNNKRIPYAVKISVSRSWWWTKDCPKHVELIL